MKVKKSHALGAFTTAAFLAIQALLTPLNAVFAAEEGAALDHCVFVSSVAASGLTEKGSRDVTIIATDDRDITNLLRFHEGERELGYPEGNGVYISEKLKRVV